MIQHGRHTRDHEEGMDAEVDRHDWGIDALATDPIDTNRLYLAVGMYTISWDPNVGSILRSTDQGTTWSESKLPFKVGGNMPGRGVGEVSLCC